LVSAARAGAEHADLAGLAEEIHRRCARPDADDGDDSFARRRLRLTRHYQGHARLDADLTPQAATALRAVLDALGKKAGPEDDRTQSQRDHDALEEACRRLVAGRLPDRAGQPTQIQLVMTLDQLLGLPGATLDTCTPNLPGASDATSPWTPAPPGADRDASIAPIVIGHVDIEVADELAARADRQFTIAEAARLLSGPAGLASWLRTGKLTGPAGSASLPLDIGRAPEVVPPYLRRAVVRRDRHCRFPGCYQRPAVCQVHHLVPRSEGGVTSLGNCGLFCGFHHLIAIHRWGWKVTLNPDGTTTATLGERTLRSNAMPAAA
jgi:hypothetical protein